MEKKLVIPLILCILFILLACSIVNQGRDFMDDEESNLLETDTAIMQMISELNEEPPSSEGEAPAAPVQLTKALKTTAVTDPIPEPVSSTTAEYTVTAQNFDCICSETGTITKELTIVGDQLHIGKLVFDNIGGNSYKRSWMGYYILVSGEGENKTETRVEEIQSSVIILTDTGYILENYKGDSGSPCCIYTFTKNP